MPEVCDSTFPLTEENYWFTGLQGTINTMATLFIDAMQTEQSYVKSTNLFHAIMWNGTSTDFNSAVRKSAQSEPGCYLWLLFGAVLCLLSFLWGLTVFKGYRRRNTRRSRNKNGNSCGIFAQFFFYSLSAVLILMCLVTYWIAFSERNDPNTVEILQGPQIAKIFNVSLTGSKGTQCTYEATIAKSFAAASESMLTEPAVLVKWFEDYSGLSKINMLEVQGLQTSLDSVNFWCNNLISELLRLRKNLVDCPACIDEIDYNLNVLYNTSESLHNLVNEMPVMISYLNQSLTTGLETANTFGQHLAVPFAKQLKNINLTGTKIRNVLNSVDHVGDMSAFWASKVSWSLGLYVQQGVAHSALQVTFLIIIVIISLTSMITLSTTCATIWSKTHRTCFNCICDFPLDPQNLLRVSFYVFVCCAPIVLIIAMTNYALAYPTSSICTFLHDPQGRYYFYQNVQMERYSNQISYVTYSQGNHTINYGVLLSELSNTDTLYSALDGNNSVLIDPSEVSRDLGFKNMQEVNDVINTEYFNIYSDFIDSQRFKASDYNFISSTQTLDDLQMTGFLPNTINKTTQARSLVKELNAFTVETKTAQYEIEVLNYLIQVLMSLNEQELRGLMIAHVNEQFIQQEAQTETAVDNFLNLMKRQVYNSKIVYYAYTNPVSRFCLSARQPDNAVFASSGLLFFVMLFAAFMFRCSSQSAVIKASSMRAYIPSRPAPPRPSGAPQSLLMACPPREINLELYLAQYPTAPAESPLSSTETSSTTTFYDDGLGPPSSRPPIQQMNIADLAREQGTPEITSSAAKWG